MMFNAAELENADLISEIAELKKGGAQRTQSTHKSTGKLELMKAQNKITAQAARIQKLERAVKTLAMRLKQ
tara:strand:- start:82151 stop:82363 length:213 start_codon:yes stop_codon:yes gene_type:complete